MFNINIRLGPLSTPTLDETLACPIESGLERRSKERKT
jgi:hypothetical protein